ncbi:hypothetical protein [Membranihabitans marinus]|uniref:hypothetical protein n=1 Tax=Membranihabitans marinus TaxID=1227546 RepID=UPI001F3F7650|nr:hypothetical protein [Membranihabitans marinus]
MKITNFYFLALTFAMFLWTNSINAQDFSNKKTTIVQFDFMIFESFYNALDPYSPTTSREKSDYKTAKEYANKLFLDKLNEMVSEKLKTEVAIQLEPMTALEDYKVVYNHYGFPNTIIAKPVIKKVSKNGYSSDYYLAVKTNIQASTDILGKAKLVNQVKDQIDVVIVLYDDKGNKLDKFEGKYKAKEAKKAKSFPSGKFNKLESDYMDHLVEMLLPGIEEAVDKAVVNMVGS